jgi:uncharacterized protein
MGKLRKWNNILHRDIGYLIVGLTVIYGVSGIAVNHVADWNPSYSTIVEWKEIEPILATERESIVTEARSKLSLSEEPRDAFRPDPSTLQLFTEDLTYSIDLPTGTVKVEQVRTRPILFEFNQLHLNSPKEAWTYIADLYALSLILVAITGMFVLKGKVGLGGRGWWLVTLGILVPVLYWMIFV